jgi:FMN reductase
MHSEVLFISGSPQPNSRSARVAQAVAAKLDAADVRVRRYGLSDFESSDLLYARGDSRAALQYLEAVAGASAVIFSSPVYKATYSGGLKLLVDLIPPDALQGKTVLAIASARIGRHFQSVQRAFDDLYRFFDVGFVIPPVFVLDEQVRLDERGLSCDASAEAAIERAATALLSALASAERTAAIG